MIRHRRNLVLVPTILALLVLAPAAGAEVLYEQGPSTIGFHPISQSYEASGAANDTLAADDFRVPVGQVWHIERVFIDGCKPFDSEPGTTDTVNTFLFATNGTVPSEAPFYSQTVTANPGTVYPDFDLTLPGVPDLPTGDWWLGAQVQLDFAPGSDGDPNTTGSYWVWGTDRDLVGNRAVQRNPGGGLQPNGCLAFGPIATCADDPNRGFDVTNPDLSFRIEGTRTLLAGPPAPPPAAPGPPADTRAPQTRLTAGPKRRQTNRTARFRFTSTEKGSSFQCKLDRGRFRRCTSPKSVRVRLGRHRFSVRAIDRAGNVDRSPASRSWTVKAKKRRGGPR